MNIYHKGVGRKTADALKDSMINSSCERNSVFKLFNFYFSGKIPFAFSYSIDAQTKGPTPLQSFSITGSEM